MATNFPISLDTLLNPSPGDLLSDATYSHAQQHSNLNDAVEALEAKVGINGSSVASTLDYLLRHSSSNNPGHVHSKLRNQTNTMDALVVDDFGVVHVLAELRTTYNIPGTVLITGANYTVHGDPELVFDGSRNRFGVGLGGPRTNLHVLGWHEYNEGLAKFESVTSHAFANLSSPAGMQAGVCFQKDNVSKWFTFCEVGAGAEYRISQGVGNTRLAIIDGGFVGVNTAAPSSRLTVADDAVEYVGPLAVKTAAVSSQGAGITLDASTNIGARRYSLMSTGGLSSIGAGFFGIYDVTASAFRLLMSAGGNVSLSGSSPTGKFELGAGNLVMSEMSDPAAPAADKGTVYVRDNGAGKSQLCVRFPTGAVQVIATEP